MNRRDIIDGLIEHEVNEEDIGSNPAFLLNINDDDLEQARDMVERMKMHIEDVINYRHDMEEYNDVAD